MNLHVHTTAAMICIQCRLPADATIIIRAEEQNPAQDADAIASFAAAGLHTVEDADGRVLAVIAGACKACITENLQQHTSGNFQWPETPKDFDWDAAFEGLRKQMREMSDDELAFQDRFLRKEMAVASPQNVQTFSMYLEFIEEEVARRKGVPYAPPPAHSASDGQREVLKAVVELARRGTQPTVRQVAKKIGRSRKQTRLLIQSCVTDGLLKWEAPL